MQLYVRPDISSTPRSDGWWRWGRAFYSCESSATSGRASRSDFYVSTFWQSISGESWTFIFGASKETSTEIFVNPAEGCAQSPRVNLCSCLRARGLHNTFHGDDHEVGASPLDLFEQPARSFFQQPAARETNIEAVRRREVGCTLTARGATEVRRGARRRDFAMVKTIED